jgi:DNA-binding LytR/AlgR family response regulator
LNIQTTATHWKLKSQPKQPAALGRRSYRCLAGKWAHRLLPSAAILIITCFAYRMEPKIKILIIEDEALIAEDMRLTLEDLGYEVIDCCYNYTEGASAIRRKEADLVMLDINLGGSDDAQNGLKLAAILQSEVKVPFIFLTAYSDTDTIRRATKLQPSGYLIKPVNAATVFAAIQTAIEHDGGKTADPSGIERPDFFFVKVGAKNHKLLWDDVFCIEAGKNYVRLRISGSATEYPIRGTLTFVLDQLLPERLEAKFLRVNRSTSLNRRFITAFSGTRIYCSGLEFENTRFSAKELTEMLEHEPRLPGA